jgi:hypothetical protein
MRLRFPHLVKPATPSKKPRPLRNRSVLKNLPPPSNPIAILPKARLNPTKIRLNPQKFKYFHGIAACMY